MTKNCIVKKISLTLLLYYFCSEAGLGHDTIENQIHTFSSEISSSPLNTRHLIKRATLYIEDGNYNNAKKDLTRVLKLQPQNPKALYHLASVELKSRNYNKANEIIKKFISLVHKKSIPLARGYRLLGQSYASQNKYEEATDAYLKALNSSTKPHSMFFIDLALIYKKQNHFEEALKVIKQGIHQHGSISVLEKLALDIEIQTHSYEAAISRLGGLIKKGQGLAYIYKTKGDVLKKAQLNIKANIAYKNALKELDKLSLIRKQTNAAIILKKQIKIGIKETSEFN